MILPSISFILYLGKRYNFNPDREYFRFVHETPVEEQDLSIRSIFESYLRTASIAFNIPEAKITSKSRVRELVYIRHMLVYVCVANRIGGWASIGRLLNRDHASIINGAKQAADLIEVKDPEFMIYYNGLKHLIN